MKIRAVTIAALLALLSAASAPARIIVDESAPEQTPEPGIRSTESDNSGADEKPQDTLSFLNKDQLHGILLSIDPDTGLHWQSPEAQDPIIFKTGELSEIKLDSHKPANTPNSSERIALTNGDEFPGNIVSLDDKALLLDTWYAGRLSIPRPMVRSITPLSDANGAVYQGPASLDGWTIPRVGAGRSWSFSDGSLVGTNFGTIGRDVDLPANSNLEFDLILRGNNQLGVGIYSDRPDGFGNCYMLLLSSNYVQLQRLSRTGGPSDLGNAQTDNILRHDKSHIELRASKEKKSIWLLVDGKIIKEWNDPAEFNGDGSNIIFSCQPGTYARISNIKVSKWDGKFDDTDNSGAPVDQDSLQLANEDRISGRLDSIQNGKAKLASSYAELEIPLERVAQIEMATAHSDQAKPSPSDIRAYFPQGGSVTMQLTQWDAKGCTGSSPNFGKATFSPGAFARITFNLPAQQQAQESESNSDIDSLDPGEHD